MTIRPLLCVRAGALCVRRPFLRPPARRRVPLVYGKIKYLCCRELFRT
jgi:hypothetical protein